MSGRPRLLDLFCGAGGAAMGYHRAGFGVVGVDIAPQPRYPFEFHQADALEFPLDGFDAVHASPPCQAYTNLSKRWAGRRHPDLVGAVRERLVTWAGTTSRAPRVWIIENVPGAPVYRTVTLCGSAFGLDVRRHRIFESNVALLGAPCQHGRQEPRFRSLDKRRGHKPASVVGVHGHLNYPGELELRQRAMGIDWMGNRELTQAIPPAFTEYLGRQLLAAIEAAA